MNVEPSSRVPDTWRFADDGSIPNHPRYPVLHYHGVLAPGADDAAASLEALFRQHCWPPEWRNGVYRYHHYHSTAHETLGVASGHARVMLGGKRGRELPLRAGDVLVLPAGTGHCCLEASADFMVIGAYPPGQHWDVMHGESQERPAVLQRIAAVPRPGCDPVGGEYGALRLLWRN